MDYPAITFCNPKGYDTGEYTRAVFNNFAFSEKEPPTDSSKSKPLRDAFSDLINDISNQEFTYDEDTKLEVFQC